MPQYMQIEEPPKARAGFALWALAFRPFYLLASMFAALSIALWGLQSTGWLGRPYLPTPLWHAHEMLFGFTLAVVVGFLFTAGRNWSNRPTPTGWKLAAIAGLWVAGRVLVLTPFGWAAAFVNAAFPLVAAIALGMPFFASRNRRNYFFVGLLAALSVAQFVFHLAQLGVIGVPPWAGIQLGLDMVLFILCVMGGRVIPMFTNNGVPGANATRRNWLEKTALGLVIALALADLAQAPAILVAAIGVAGAVAHGARWSLWQPWTTLRTPLVWVLHVAYAWIPVHLALRAAAAMGLVAPTLATHALTVGAVGGLIIGMLVRTARGHTGRPLLPDHYEVACFLMVSVAAVLRVLLPLVAPGLWLTAVGGSAFLWSAAFALYAVRYWPLLIRPRIDGLPG